MGAIKIIPDKEHLLEMKSDIERILQRKISESSDMFLIDQIVNHNVAVYAHIERLEKMIVGLQERLLFAKDIYDDLLSEYGNLSERETRMIRWIIKHKHNGKKNS